ncbi:MAG: D-aminoacylase [Clostridia bacterium]|nr:D-aminoacylase [Clostridia bacterium]
MFDLIIKNGIVVDGTGAPRFRADVAVKDGLIAKIAPSIGDEANKVIDACGKIVAPGFIDTHTHSDSSVFNPESTGYNHLEDGATTEIAGQCGSFPAPYYGDYNPTSGLSEEEFAKVCESYTSYFKYVESIPHGANMAYFVGQGPIRGKVMGHGEGVPNEEQLQQMRDLMQEAMDCGALGFSTGLVYTPSVFAGTEELIEIAKVAHKNGGLHTTHLRGEGNQLKDSIEEAMVISRASGIPLNISHIKVIGHHNEGMSADIIKYIEENQKAGLTVWADQYPFTGGSAPLISQIPPKYLTEGKDISLRKLAESKELRDKAEWSIFNEAAEFESNIYSAGYEGCLIAGAYKTQDHVGKTIAQLAAEWGKEPFDTVVELLAQNEGIVQGIYFAQNESDLLNYLAQPWVMAGSDWSDYAAPVDPEKRAGGHPRGMATMVHRLELVRDHGIESLESAIHRITGLPSEVYGLPTIGKLQEGKAADLTIFDYAALKSNCDYDYPFRRNEGIDYVIVNGAVAVENGRFTGVKNGKVLKMQR